MGEQVRSGAVPAAKRGRWTAEQRAEILQASDVPGASINEVARQFGIRPNLLTSWRRRRTRQIAAVRSAKKPTGFAAVRVTPAPVEGTIEIDIANGLICVRGMVDAQMLREVLAAIR